jgi:hypothetical protein
MTRHLQMSVIAVFGSIALAGAALAQEIEPGVQTSSSAAPVQQPPAPPAPPAAKPGAEPKLAPDSKSRNAPATTPPAAPKTSNVPAGNAKSSDRIELGTTQISGNRELPKVMYVVPWRRADPGDFAGRPPNSLLDEALTPVDRDVFRRQNSYYGAVSNQAPASAPQSGAAAPPAGAATPKDEK